MNLLEALFAQSFIQALGWSLIHFVWQGAAVAAALAGANILLRKRSANARYFAACAALAMMLALMAGNLLYFTSPSPSFARGVAPAPADAGKLQTTPASIIDHKASVSGFEPTLFEGKTRRAVKQLLPWVVGVWLFGVLALSARLAGGFVQARRLRRRDTQEVSTRRQQLFADLARRLRVSKPVVLLESSLVQSPMAMGWLRPVILIPASALVGLTPEQLEAIIAHELAHIRRHDYLVNLLQTVIETLLFYHPAAWWVSRQIRNERENCCDDMAVAACGDALVYARALTKVERLRKARLELAVTANGGILMNRINRLVGAEPPRAYHSAGLVTCLIAILTLAAIVAGTQLSPFPNSTAIGNREEINAGQLDAAITPPPSPSAAASTKPQSHRKETNAEEASLVQPAEPASVQSQAPEGIRDFVNALSSADPQERATAACSLATAGDEAAIPFLIQALGDEAPISQTGCKWDGRWSPAMSSFKRPSPGEQAAIALASFGQVAVAPLTAALSHASPVVRRNAAWAIGEVRGGPGTDRRDAYEPLIAALTDEDAWVRRAAAFAFAEIREHRAVRALIAALTDPDSQVRDMVVYALGEMKESRAVEQLSVTLLKDENPGVRVRTAWALGEIRDPQAVEALMAALNDEDGRVRSKAKWALSEIQD
ncbi:MAG TPA: M56 family metallopeptidase [Blastocatellia bacterium]|nr:M56 family metallopeptidase [Blastocatellia bacterium]